MLEDVLPPEPRVEAAAGGAEDTSADTEDTTADDEDTTAEDEDTMDDLLIAQMLQKQFDNEYDAALGKEETQINGSSKVHLHLHLHLHLPKVRVSYSKYRMVPEEIVWDDSEEEEEEEEEVWVKGRGMMRRDWDRFETKEKELGQMPLCGYKKVGPCGAVRCRNILA